MSRPFAVLGFSFLFALVVGVFVGAGASLPAGLAALLVSVLILIFTRAGGRKIPAVICASLFSFSAALIIYSIALPLYTSIPKSLDGESFSAQLTVLDYPYEQYGRVYYSAKITSLERDGEALEISPFKVRLTCSAALMAEPYDSVKCKIGLFSFGDERGFSSANSRLADGAVMGAYLQGNAEITESTDRPPLYYFKRLNKELSGKLYDNLPKEYSSLIGAVLLGDRNSVSAETASAFRMAGTSHLLVVSGVHMSAAAVFFLSFFSLFKLRKKTKSMLAMPCILAFMLVTGLQPSVLRSGIMFLLMLSADLFGRESDSLNSLGFAVLLICLSNPFSGGDIGLLLSVLATLGIILFSQRLRKFLLRPLSSHRKAARLLSPIASAISVSLCAMLFTLPIAMLSFGSISLLSPISGILLILPATLLIYSSMLALLFAYIPFLLPLSHLFFFFCGLLAKYMLSCADTLAAFGGALYLGSSSALLVLAGVLVLLAVLRLKKPGAPAVFAACLMVSFMLLCSGAISRMSVGGTVRIAVVNAQEDSCVLLISDGRAAALELGGYISSLPCEILERNGTVSVSTIFFPQINDDAVKAAELIVKKYPPENIVSIDSAAVPGNVARGASRLQNLVFEHGYSPIAGVYAEYSGNSLTFTANGRKVMLETGEERSGQCNLLITKNSGTRLSASLTFMQAEDLESLPALSGSYILSGEAEVTYIDIFPEGEIRISRE